MKRWHLSEHQCSTGASKHTGGSRSWPRHGASVLGVGRPSTLGTTQHTARGHFLMAETGTRDSAGALKKTQGLKRKWRDGLTGMWWLPPKRGLGTQHRAHSPARPGPGIKVPRCPEAPTNRLCGPRCILGPLKTHWEKQEELPTSDLGSQGDQV